MIRVYPRVRDSFPPFTQGDPLTALLRGRYDVPPWAAAVGWFLIINIPMIVAASVVGFWQSKPGQMGLLSDPPTWFFQAVSVPAIVITFFWLPGGISDVLQRLEANGVILPPPQSESSRDAYGEFVSRFERVYSHWAWFVVSLCLVGAFTGFLLVPLHRSYPFWNNATEFVFWYSEFGWLVIYSMLCMMTFRCLIAIIWFNRLFKHFPIEVKELHPDGAGGLAPLGEFSVKMGYFLGINGVSLLLISYTRGYYLSGEVFGIVPTPSTIILVVLYFVATPVVFFGPIRAAHAAMKQAKESFLLQVSDQFEAEKESIISVLKSVGPEEINRSLEKISHLQRLYHIASDFPAWPVNLRSLVHFLTSVLAPLILGLIPTVIELLARR